MTEKQALNMSAEVQTFSEVDQFLAEVKKRSHDHDVIFSLTKEPFGSESVGISYYSVPEALAAEENDEISEEQKANIRRDVAGMIFRSPDRFQLVNELEQYFEIDFEKYFDTAESESVEVDLDQDPPEERPVKKRRADHEF